MTTETRGLIRACAAICEAQGRVDLAVRLLDLIPEPCKVHQYDFGGTCMACMETITREDNNDG